MIPSITSLQIQARAITGSPRFRRVIARLRRSDFTLKSAAAAIVLLVLVSFAIYDFVTAASQKDQQIQESALKGQLAEFLLLTREPDGSSLLENSQEFTKARRAARVVTLKRPFFSYFLNKGNARNFRTEDIRWDPPRACVLEFVNEKPSAMGQSHPVQACFAALPSDPSGRYVYFSLRYPSLEIHRHQRGQPAAESDRVVLRFVGKKEVKLHLAFEKPPLTNSRQASQMKRFDGLHELTGFLSDEGGQAVRYVNAQAYERRGDGSLDTDQMFITMLGRIDASILADTTDGAGEWPSRAIKSLAIGVDILPPRNGQTPTKPVGFAPGAKGTALVSLEQAYLSAVSSRADLEVKAGIGGETLKRVWHSDDAEISPTPRRPGWIQKVSDMLAKAFVSGTPPVTVKQQQRVAGLPQITATLSAEAIVLPDIATRAFAALIAALLVIIAISFVLWGAVRRLDSLTRTAYRIASNRHNDNRLAEYASSDNQIGTLGRVLYLMFSRDRARTARDTKRRQREDNQRREAVRRADARVKIRQGNLDAIGHEIRSPLQSLLNGIPKESVHYSKLERMQRAFNALYDVTKIEDGLKSGFIVPVKGDVASYLASMATNLWDEGKQVVYVGPPEGVDATFDSIQLEQLLDHMIANALRHRQPGSDVELRLKKDDLGAVVEVFNRGSHIPEDMLEKIFSFGVTTNTDSTEHRGQGLFAAINLAVAMRGTLHVENREDGVAFVLTLPSELELWLGE
jgi:signal transduction histidine kinase